MGAPQVIDDWHGLHLPYERAADGLRSPVLASLVEPSTSLDRAGVLSAFGRRPMGRRTVFDGVVRSERHPVVPGEVPSLEALLACFTDAVTTIATCAERPALALGGGLDAALVLAAWPRTNAPRPTVVTLRTGHTTYDEVAEAGAIAGALDAPLEVVSLPRDAAARGLADAALAFETPVYNLHPVWRHRLAVEVAARGHDALVTGDGADALSRGAPDDDYVPLMARSARAAGTALRSPFFDRRLVGSLLALAPDEGKRVLRELGDALELPRWLLEREKKHGRLAPPIDTTPAAPTDPLERLADELGLPLSLDEDRDRVAWLSLYALTRRLRGAPGGGA